MWQISRVGVLTAAPVTATPVTIHGGWDGRDENGLTGSIVESSASVHTGIKPVASVDSSVTDDRTRWNEKHRDDEFELPKRPTPELERWLEALPPGRALDVATGTGRNALFLAEAGYEVDAVDVSDEALAIARERADERGLEVNWIRADVAEFDLERAYDVITVSYFAALDLLPELKEALEPGGVLVYEHHLRAADEIDVGPSSDRHRYRANDLLRACLDLTILHYEERLRTVNDGTAAVATLVARNTNGGTQSYPELPEAEPNG